MLQSDPDLKMREQNLGLPSPKTGDKTYIVLTRSATSQLDADFNGK